MFQCLYYRDQCEELRAILTRRYGDEVCRDRAEQLRLKEEERKRQQESTFTVLCSPFQLHVGVAVVTSSVQCMACYSQNLVTQDYLKLMCLDVH